MSEEGLSSFVIQPCISPNNSLTRLNYDLLETFFELLCCRLRSGVMLTRDLGFIGGLLGLGVLDSRFPCSLYFSAMRSSSIYFYFWADRISFGLFANKSADFSTNPSIRRISDSSFPFASSISVVPISDFLRVCLVPISEFLLQELFRLSFLSNVGHSGPSEFPKLLRVLSSPEFTKEPISKKEEVEWRVGDFV